MQAVNRSVAVIRPTEKFLGWVNAIPSDRTRMSLAALRSECIVILVPHLAFEGDAYRYVYSRCEEILGQELGRWSVDRTRWPEGRPIDTFKEFFDIEIISRVIDMVEGDASA